MNDPVDLPPEADSSIAKKWNKLLRRARLFNFIPFVDFVLVAGSMAMGDADEDSDFDVIVGVKTGRIFTVRAFCVLFFGLFGWRAKHLPQTSFQYTVLLKKRHSSKDKFCFSHFVTPEKYCLSEPCNEYWKKLYLSLVPIYGEMDLIQKFYDANSNWLGQKRVYTTDDQNLYSLCHSRSLFVIPAKAGIQKAMYFGKPGFRIECGMTAGGLINKTLEKILSGKFGNFLEKWLKKNQIKKIEKSLKTIKQHKPRIIFNDSELEFHPDTERIDKYCQKI